MYHDFMRGLCASLAGRRIPVVAAHNDLTMENVVVNGAKPLGVVDWEVATEDGLPMADFFYAVADACAAARRYQDRAAAYRESFDVGTPYGRLVAGWSSRLSHTLGLSATTALLLRHVTALQHAANEQRQRKTIPGPSPFLEIAGTLAADPIGTGAFQS